MRIKIPMDDGRVKPISGTQAQKGRKGFQPVKPELKRVSKVFHIQQYLDAWLDEESLNRSMSRSEFINVLIRGEMDRVNKAEQQLQ